MNHRERIVRLIYAAVDEVNQDLSAEKRLEQSENAILFGRGAKFDSMALINLIVATEENVADEFGVGLTLAHERALSQTQSPFHTLGSFADYVHVLLQENGIYGG